MKGKLLKILGSILIIIVLGICVQILLSISPGRGDVETNNSLSNPFLVLAAEPELPGTTFLEKEAGISGYTNVGKEIDLTKAREGFKTVEAETDEYIIGSIMTTDTDTDDAHCYLHKDGWVVAYYSKNDPISKTIYWLNLQTTKLEKGMSDFCAVVGVPLLEVKYYDFRYPDAQKLMVITKRNGDFDLKIPNSYTVYERSYSIYYSGYYRRNFAIDRIIIASVSEGVKYGTLTPTQLSPDALHTISFHGFGVAIVLAYREG